MWLPGTKIKHATKTRSLLVNIYSLMGDLQTIGIVNYIGFVRLMTP